MITKALPSVLITILIAGMSIFSVFQFNTIEDQTVTIDEQAKEIDFLEGSLQSEEAANAALLVDVAFWREKYEAAVDSLSLLKKEIKKYKSTIKKLNKEIRAKDKLLNDFERKYGALKGKIAELARNDEVDRQLIAKLEADKAELRKEIANLTVAKEQEVVQRQETEAELLDRQVSEARFRRITNLVNNTSVVFNKVALSKKRFGKPIKKIKDNNTKWKYTVIEFFLDHQDLKLLLDEQFVVKIVNSDTGEILSYIESNPNFPNSTKDSKGIEFKYDGNMVEVSYFNNQEKKGDNYEIQVYYINDGEEFLLLNGIQPFIKGRKVVTP